MADIPPNPVPTPNLTGTALPAKKETGKVQPKKETVRINLPPKPTAAPTIKLPTLPPGGPTGAPSPVSIGAPAATAPAPVMRTAAAPAASAAPVKSGAAPATAQKPAPAAQRAAAPIVPSIKPLDKILIYSAAVAGLVAVGYNFYVFFFVLKPLVENFSS
jgi:hypothetical protein